MSFASISIGSNLSLPLEQVQKAFELISNIPGTKVDKQSSCYQTPPWGKQDQPPFINAVVGVYTELAPLDLLGTLQQIELQQGRTRKEKWGPRTLDLDIICYDQLNIKTADLNLPHPRFSEREFVLLPLSEIYPNLLIMGRSANDWLDQLRREPPPESLQSAIIRIE